MVAKKRNVYFDNAATTKVDPNVLNAMLPYFSEIYGNSHSLHAFGFDAEEAIEKSRAKIADILNVHPSEILFSGNGVDSDEVIIKTLLESNRSIGKHILFSSIEHRGLMNKAKTLERQGYKVDFIDSGTNGVINVNDLESKLQKDTALVSIVHVNGDTGMIQPIEKITKIIKQKSNALVHSDGVQAIVGLDVDLNRLGVDAYNFTAHKIYGPKGISTIYSKNVLIDSSLVEKGTQNTPLIVGMAKSLELWDKTRKNEIVRINKINQPLIHEVLKEIPSSILIGDEKFKIPQITSFAFKGVHRELLTLKLNDEGFATSPGAACASRDVEASHILKAMKVDREYINGSLRISLGRDNSMEEVYLFVNKLSKVVNEIRNR